MVGRVWVCCRCCASHSARACSSVLTPLNWLHVRCMSRVFDRCSGEPPLALGMISSTSALMGWGMHPGHPVWGHRL